MMAVVVRWLILLPLFLILLRVGCCAATLAVDSDDETVTVTSEEGQEDIVVDPLFAYFGDHLASPNGGGGEGDGDNMLFPTAAQWRRLVGEPFVDVQRHMYE
jgi:hypothetical protein